MTNKREAKGLEDLPFMKTIEGEYLVDKIGKTACEKIAKKLGNEGLEQRYKLYVAEHGEPSYGELYWND